MEQPRTSIARTTVTLLKQAADRSARLVHWHHWQGRLVLALGAVVLAAAILLFSTLVDIATERFIVMRATMPWLPLILTPAGGVVVVYLTRRFFPGAAGSGIPQTIAALKPQRKSADRRGLVSLRLAAGKISLVDLFPGEPRQGEKGVWTPFDPAVHHAVHQVESDELPPNTVSEVFQQGYMLNDRLLRAAMVVVAVPPKT